MNRVIFINSHPIQYFAPLYQDINRKKAVSLEVLYCSDESIKGYLDKEFSTNIKWDIPLLEGYNYRFFNNHSWKPGIRNGFFGLINLAIIKYLINQPKSIIIIHGWSYFTHVALIFFSKIVGHTVCLRGESPLIHEHLKKPLAVSLKKLFFKFYLNVFVDKFLYIGQENKRYYEFYKVNNKKLLHIPYAVDNNRFSSYHKQNIQSKESLKQQLGLPADSKVILFSGKYITKKRPIDLLEAYHTLNIPNKALVMVGEGELRNQMEKYIWEKGLKNVILTGFINQSAIPNYYSMADVFVMCSGVGETWGLSINEAMNFALPIVASDLTGSSKDLVLEGVNGYVFETGNTFMLAEKLEVILSDDHKRDQMGQESLEIIKNYSYEVIANNLEKIK